MEKATKKKKYDPVLRGKALTGLTLRIAVAAYMVYLAWKILSGMLSGGSAIPIWGAWLITFVFGAVAVVFCGYAWIAFRKALKNAKITELTEVKSSDYEDV